MCSTLEKTRLTVCFTLLSCFFIIIFFFFLCLYVDSTISLVLHKSFPGNLQTVLGNWKLLKPVKLEYLGTHYLSFQVGNVIFMLCFSHKLGRKFSRGKIKYIKPIKQPNRKIVQYHIGISYRKIKEW